MAVSKSNKKKQCYISVPSQIINSISSSSLESLLLSPKKKAQSHVFSLKFRFLWKNPRFWLFLVLVFGFLGMLRFFFNYDPVVPFTPNTCPNFEEKSVVSKEFLSTQLVAKETGEKMVENVEMGGDGGEGNVDEKREFWTQPDGLGYRPCLEFSREYRRTSVDVVEDRTKYLMVVVAGGLNQQRKQIVDAVVMARILEAALVVPILQVNVIWGDESEFSDIFDLDHFKKVLENDLRIVSSLPSTHVMTRPVDTRSKRKRETIEIDFEALKRHGFEGGPSVLNVPPLSQADDQKQDWSWSKGEESRAKETEETYADRLKTRAAIIDGERLANVQTTREKREHSFSQKEKRKRDLGQASRGKNYVEEEKRLLRESGIYSGFDS